MMIDAPFVGGDPNSTIALVGEAPGKMEQRHGGAFIGNAGDLLTEQLASAGINRSLCYLDNLFQFHPERDNLEPYIGFSVNQRTKVVTPKPTPIYEENLEALKLRLEESSANIIVTFGNIAMFALTGKYGITKWRGSVLPSTLLPGRKVLPTIHPAASLRGDYNWRYFTGFDLVQAKSQAEFPEIRRLDRLLEIDPTLNEVREFLQLCSTQKLVAYDIETRGTHLSHISFATSPDHAMCIPLASGARDIWDPEQELEIMMLVGELLENEKVEKLAHNAVFDTTFMYRHYGIKVAPVHDTMIAAAMIFPDFPKGLDFLTSLYCEGEPYYKDDGKEWRRHTATSEEEYRRYNAMDSAVLPQIFDRQLNDLQRSGNMDIYEQQRRLIPPLVFAGDHGILMEQEGRAEALESCTKRIDALEAQIEAIVGPDLNYDSSKQLVHYFYIMKGLRMKKKRRKDGRMTPTVDEKALKDIAAQGHIEAQLILESRKLKKMKSTYYEMKLDSDNRIRCSWNPVGTVNNRLSSSQALTGTGGNMQNLPPDMRRLLLADEGGIIVINDLAQAENRLVAYEAVERAMIEAIEAGIDIHTQTGCLIHGIPIDQCTPEIRADGKVANHGLNYGFGAKNFAIQYGLTYKRGQWIHSRYHAVYPGVHDWHRTIREELASKGRVLVNCYGRSRRFLGEMDDKLFEKAYNYKPQSTVAIKINMDGFNHIYYDQETYHDVALINQVHDAVWYWIPLRLGYENIVRIIESICTSLQTPLEIKGHSVALPSDTKIGFRVDEDVMLEWKASKVKLSDTSKRAEELERYVYEQAAA